jgi:cobaltochelatase CobT
MLDGLRQGLASMAGAFPQGTIAAVATCTRTLSGTDLGEATLASSTAATLGSLRAFADRLAIRSRHHVPTIYRWAQPDEPSTARTYAALELARLDTLGVQWLEGVARNLLAHPGTDDDGVRWLAFESFSGRSAPDVKAAAVARLRAQLPQELADSLRSLAAHVRDPLQFAPAAAEWARQAERHLPEPDPDGGTERARLLPTRYIDRPQRRPPAPAASSKRPGERRRPRDEDVVGAGPGDRSAGADSLANADYRIYTTAHDRVISAAALATRQDLARLQGALQTELSSIRTVVARLAKNLLRILMARQMRQWKFDQDEGLLDASRLSSFVASGGNARPFKQESESPFPDTVVTLLIDHSGSMRGRPMQIAALTVEIFVRVLERCGIRCEVLGFTTREWSGGEPAHQWEAEGYAESPGRINALEHIIIKGADVPWRRARVGLGLSMRDEILKENIDGEAVLWAHGRLLARPEPRRILVVVSDGTPMDEATLTANGFDYLDNHLAAVVDRIERTSPVQLAAIGIGHDVSRFYRNATRIAKMEDLGPALTTKLMSLLAADDGGTGRRRRMRSG